MTNLKEAHVSIGDGMVVIKFQGVSKKVVANIIGTESNQGEVNRIYLDRLVHAPANTEIGSWQVTGAISSILYR